MGQASRDERHSPGVDFVTNNPASPPQPPGPSDAGAYGGRTLSGKVVVFAAVGLFLTLVFAVGGFVLFGKGPSEVVAVRISEIRVDGDSYVVAFDAKGFTPAEDGPSLIFYWDGQNPEILSISYWGPSPFTGIGAGTAPPRSEKICVALVTRAGEVNTGAGGCKRIP